MSKHGTGTLIRFQIDHVTKAQFRFLELRFDRRLQVLDQVRHTTIYDRRSGWRRRRHSDPDVYRRPAFDLCSPRRDLPDHGAFALRRLLIADLTEAQLRSLDLRSDFLTPIFKQVWHPTWLDVTLGLLIDFRRHSTATQTSTSDPHRVFAPAAGDCLRMVPLRCRSVSTFSTLPSVRRFPFRSRLALAASESSGTMQIGMCWDASGTATAVEASGSLVQRFWQGGVSRSAFGWGAKCSEWFAFAQPRGPEVRSRAEPEGASRSPSAANHALHAWPRSFEATALFRVPNATGCYEPPGRRFNVGYG